MQEEKHQKLSDYLNQIWNIAFLKALQGLASMCFTPELQLKRQCNYTFMNGDMEHWLQLKMKFLLSNDMKIVISLGMWTFGEGNENWVNLLVIPLHIFVMKIYGMF